MNPRTGFLIELGVAALSLILILAWGHAGFTLILLFGFRPFILKNSRSANEADSVRLYRYAFRFSLALTALIMFSAWFLLPAGRTVQGGIFFFTAALPLYFLLHGLTGLVLYSRYLESHPPPHQ